MPEPRAIIERTRALFATAAGRWEGSESIAPMPWAPDGMTALGCTHGHLILDGRGLASDYAQEIGGEVTLTAHTVMILDEATGRVHLHFFSQGAVPTVLEGTAEGDTLTVEGPGPAGVMRQTFVYRDDEMEVTAESRGEDGRWMPLFTGTYARR